MVQDKISRRVLLRNAALTAGIVASAAAASGCEGPAAETPPPPGAKLTKAEVAYQFHPNGYQKCGVCANFLPPGKCRIVQGPIEPNGWCKRYKPRSA